MSFTSKSESVPELATFSFGEIGPGDRHIFLQRVGLIDQHIGPVAGEALVVDHIALRHRVGCVADKGHRVVRVAHVVILALRLPWAARS